MTYSDYQAWWNQHGRAHLADYAAGRTGFVHGLAPQRALQLPQTEVLQLLYQRLGPAVMQQIMGGREHPPSPVADEPNGDWLRRANVVGVNVRTIGSFWKLIHYALTLPAHIDGVHLLPIWEPGVVASLYGMSSWRINPEFFDRELAARLPGAGTVERQLEIVVDLLHALGKTVGMDVIPHTDRYSEMVIEHPAYFEWLRRDGLAITDHRSDLHEEARAVIGENDTDRLTLIQRLYDAGLEPAPATMAPPYRGLEVDPDPAAMTVDDAGRVWRDYRITEPTEMSRAFGPLTRYKFWGRKDDNRDWAIDFDRPRTDVWTYFTEQYAAVRQAYGFDFMRGDMSHVQMRPDGVPTQIDDYYDPLRAVKKHVQKSFPAFAYFAESFLAEPGVMAYGDEVEHLVASEAEVTLGNLQSLVPGSPEFMHEFGRYLEIAADTAVTPAFTVITGDKDDPRFDHFHHHGEIARFFTGLFLPNLPLYYSLGFEQRDRHYEPWANEFYTKLYVFHEQEGPKATAGPWRWGGNLALFRELDDLNVMAATLFPKLGADAGAIFVEQETVVYWTVPARNGEATYLFIVNFAAAERSGLQLDGLPDPASAELHWAWPEVETDRWSVTEIAGGGVRIYVLSAPHR